MESSLFEANLDNLDAMRHYVEQTARKMGAEQPAVDATVQATDEWTTNIILHGYRRGPGKIRIEVRRQRDDLVVTVRDGAPWFNPAVIPTPDLTLPLEERPLGGLGYYIIRKLMDRVHYRAIPEGGNELTLARKAFRGKEGETS